MSVNVLLLVVATYIITGAALTAYDFSAPPLHRKFYVVRRDHAAAFRNWFLWPFSTAFEVYQLAKLRRHAARHALGVILLSLGILVVVRFVYLVSAMLLPWPVVAYPLALLAGFLVSPIVAAFTMPKHG